jgi:Zn-dependent protease
VALPIGMLAHGDVLITLGTINLLLGLLNLAPAFPLDGGRVLRALLVPRLGPTRANDVALSIGFAGAVVLGVIGFALRQPGLVPLAIFMALLQRREQRVQRMLAQHPEWA